MPFVVIAVFLTVILVAIALIPLSIVLRYRAGTIRRPARQWLTTLNVVVLTMSALFFLSAAAMTNVWVPSAFVYALAGFGVGALLGGMGLVLTKWETSGRTMYITPNRWLVLVLTVVIAGRVLYGFWRSWHVWQTPVDGTTWLVASGAAGSLAAGAVVIGYYLSYSIGVRRRTIAHSRRT